MFQSVDQTIKLAILIVCLYISQMKAESPLELDYSGIGDIECMLLKIPKPKPLYFGWEKFLDQINIEQLSIMLTALKQRNYPSAWPKYPNSKWSIYEDVFFLSLLKINQHQLSYQSIQLIKTTVSRLTKKKYRAMKQRSQNYGHMKMNFFWESFLAQNNIYFSPRTINICKILVFYPEITLDSCIFQKVEGKEDQVQMFSVKNPFKKQHHDRQEKKNGLSSSETERLKLIFIEIKKRQLFFQKEASQSQAVPKQEKGKEENVESECESDLSIEESEEEHTFSESMTKTIEQVEKLEFIDENVDECEETSMPVKTAEESIKFVEQKKVEQRTGFLPEWRPTYGWNSEDEDPGKYFLD